MFYEFLQDVLYKKVYICDALVGNGNETKKDEEFGPYSHIYRQELKSKAKSENIFSCTVVELITKVLITVDNSYITLDHTMKLIILMKRASYRITF